MKIGIVSPAPKGSTLGNSVTADRYARIFRTLGHKVDILRRYGEESLDCMVALHARKSARSALAFSKRFPDWPLIVVLTGTDVYRDIRTSRIARRTLDAACAIVGLQPHALRELPHRLRRKAVAIVQSAKPVRSRRKDRKHFEICVIGHLRYEKDPLRAALALGFIARSVPIRVNQAGLALDERYAREARRLEKRFKDSYRYFGELSRARAGRLLASSDLMVLSSRMEGGANVLCEAIASGTPALASKISGNIGILGTRYPGYFAVADTKALARLMRRAATDRRFLKTLKQRTAKLKPLVSPSRERRLWSRVLLRATGGRRIARPKVAHTANRIAIS